MKMDIVNHAEMLERWTLQYSVSQDWEWKKLTIQELIWYKNRGTKSFGDDGCLDSNAQQ
jgi:hypothetical protein